MRWGRDDVEWQELVNEAGSFLAHQASLKRTTSYTELNVVLHQRTGVRAFNFDSEADRAAMGALLGDVTQATLPEVGAMVSSIVLYLNENDAGPGFFKLAQSLGLLPHHPTASQRFDFWIGQVKATHEHYS